MLFDTDVRVRELISMSPPDWKKLLVKVDGQNGTRSIYYATSTIVSKKSDKLREPNNAE